MERESLEYLKTPLTVVGDDPTGYAVHVALLEDGARPEPDDWHPAAWEATPTGPAAVLLVGPGAVVDPGPGTYRTWVKVVATPEVPIVKSPRFQIT
ncbi:hypothetical protein [Streptomyces sp. STCH 565 A]|uniref:hypothetical protein n=1 Tax=Streptomyces sp. STCH 565 A TaxID=2950532 RepID=UPI0020754946|nr:hypothetical protein [Streptomyces sp. STCH 565 A]MCM8548903.1 hypothetical protein [Streptomyces sp. STCH 565 A]